MIAGVDEVGRGPLAGPVMACAVILDSKKPIAGLKDSKKLSENKRVALSQMIKETAICWAIGVASVEEIDEINILQATLLAMKRAVDSLSIIPKQVLVDGNRCPKIAIPAKAIIGGDNTVIEISAASIIAKVTRDALMIELDLVYPEYGFARHKGYGTKEHLAALTKFGPCDIHRTSFSPVKLAMD